MVAAGGPLGAFGDRWGRWGPPSPLGAAGGRWGPLGAAGKHWVAAGRLLGAAKGHRWALWGAGGAGGEVLQPLRALGVLGVLGGNWGALGAARAAGPAAPAPSVLIEETNRVTKPGQIASRKIEQMPGVESRDRHADGDLKTWDVRIEKMGYEMLRGQTNSEHLHPTHACRISNFESPPFFPHFLPYSLWTLFFVKYIDIYTQHHQYFIDQIPNHTGSTSKGR